MIGHRILVTGAGGLLSPYLIDAASSHGHVTSSGRHIGDIPCDLSDSESVRALINAARPDWVVHAAAMTDIERCEAYPDQADSANRLSVSNLVAHLSDDQRIALISTDQVYPDLPGPHGETNVGPVNVYGQSKLAGEQAIAHHPGALVLRANFFGPSRTPGRRSLDGFVIDSLVSRTAVTLFTDVLFSPLHMSSLANLAIQALAKGLSGIYNLGSRDGMSKAEFALAVARHLGLDSGCASLGTSAGASNRTARPHDLRMDVTRIEQALGRPMPTLQQEIMLL